MYSVWPIAIYEYVSQLVVFISFSLRMSRREVCSRAQACFDDAVPEAQAIGFGAESFRSGCRFGLRCSLKFLLGFVGPGWRVFSCCGFGCWPLCFPFPFRDVMRQAFWAAAFAT